MQRLKQLVKRSFPRFLNRKRVSAASKNGILDWMKQLRQRPVSRLSDASYDIFTYHGEDGIILHLLQQLKEVPWVFVDIGAGDCIKSNCANLVTHFDWEGLFIDNDASQMAIGKRFFKNKIKTGDIKMIEQKITPANINALLEAEGMKGEMGLLSVDIDGNDYWIWKAIECIQPRIVVIEAKVEFGLRDIVVPYGELNHHSASKMYNGASVEALRKLGIEKGYKLVGANKQGYNLFFVREDELIPAVPAAYVLDEPETKNSFYPESFFSSHTFAGSLNK